MDIHVYYISLLAMSISQAPDAHVVPVKSLFLKLTALEVVFKIKPVSLSIGTLPPEPGIVHWHGSRRELMLCSCCVGIGRRIHGGQQIDGQVGVLEALTSKGSGRPQGR